MIFIVSRSSIPADDSNRTFQELEDRPTYDDLRAEAALHAKLRSEAFQKAARARSLKQGEVASFYAQQVRTCTCMHVAGRSVSYSYTLYM